VPLKTGRIDIATYLVTGGCGFIGSHLCQALLRRGDAVRVLDDLSTGLLSNLAAGASLIQGDVAEPSLVREALSGTKGCFHLAAVASVELSNREWLRTHHTNLTGTITVFDAAIAAGGVPVVYTSSAAVYGDCPALPLTENSEKQPLSAYAADKIGCELHARVASRVHRLPSVGLRLFNVYGPGQEPRSPYSGVISIFSERLRSGKPIEIFGDGHQTRDFVFVDDAIVAMLRAMDARLAGDHVFNVCTGRATSVLELAHTIARLCHTTPEILPKPERRGEVRHSQGDPTLARRVLGAEASTSLEVGLRIILA